MKRRFAFVFVLGMAAVLGAAPLRAAENIVGPLKTNWESIRSLVVKVAEVVPEDKYDWKPTPDVRSFREQFVHIVGENYLFMGFVAGGARARPKT